MAGLKVFETQIQAKEGVINFPGYKSLKKQAIEIAEHINTMEVTEDNVKETKKILATVNKAIKNLNDERIAIKKKMLEPYNIFESQIKEIESIVKTADERVRSGVRELEEKERELKREEIKEIWDLRIEQYELAKLFTFEDWLTPKHLNKSESLKKVEEDMVSFLEKSEQDIKVLKSMEDADDLILEYKHNKDLGFTIDLIETRKSIKKQQQKMIGKVKEAEIVFIVKNEKDAKLVELLLKENDIEYVRR